MPESSAAQKTSHNVVPQRYVLIGRITEKTSRSTHFRKILNVGWNGQRK